MSSYFLKALTQSGRTSRLLEHAESLAKEGRAVYVLSATSDQSKWLRDKFGVGKADALGIKFGTDKSIGFNWAMMRVPGAFMNCVFLPDHDLIEVRFSAILEALHRYDLALHDEPIRDFDPRSLSLNSLYAANAAMLQRWAVVYNLLKAEGELKFDAVLAVAELSATEFVKGGPEHGAMRLLRQEEGARALLAVRDVLDSGGAILPGSELHAYVVKSAELLSSYPERVG